MAKQIIFGIHGLGGHSGWFKNFEDNLKKHNIDFYAYDLPGFGTNHDLTCTGSQFIKGHIDSYQGWVNFAQEKYEEVQAQNPDAEIIVFGHSLGALIATMLPSLNKDQNLILSVPGFKGASDTFDAAFFFSTIRKIVLDKFILGNDVYVTLPPSPKKYPDPTMTDPLKITEVTQTLLLQVLKLRAVCKRQMTKLQSAVLMLQIEGDTVVDNSALPEYLDLIPHQNKELKTYSGADHDWIWSEAVCAQITKDVVTWLST